MDMLKQKCKDIKQQKRALLKQCVLTADGKSYKYVGKSHISERDYGTHRNGLFPLTNRYVKKRKKEMKIELRAVKRGAKQKIRKEMFNEKD